MAITTVELFQSRKSRTGDNPSQDRKYVVYGTTDEDAARTAFLLFIPATVVQDGETLSQSTTELDRVGTDSYQGTVVYGDKDQPGASYFSFQVATANQHITQSVDTVASYSYSLGVDAPDFKGAVGVNEKGEVQGVDIFFPTYSSSERHTLAAATVDTAYKQALFALVGKVANAAFKEYALGECLFAGASGSTKDNGDWEVTYNFAGRPNELNIDLGGVITVDAKLGWDYLWVQYEATEDPIAKRIVRQPRFAYVEQVYERGDMSLLGIGTT